MKKKIMLLIFAFALILPMKGVLAEDIGTEIGSAKISCTSVSKVGDESTCTVSLKSDQEAGLTSASMNYSFGEGVEYVANSYKKIADDWTTVKNDSTSMSLTCTGGAKTLTAIASFKVKVTDITKSTKVGLTSITLGNQDTNTGTATAVSVNLITTEDINGSNTLKSLTIDKGELGPTFNPKTLTYKVEAGESQNKITITAVATDPKATVTGAGTHTLEYGMNTIKIKVTPTEGETNIYTLKVYRSECDPEGTVIKNVPNTLQNASTIAVGIGMILIAGGIFVIAKKKKQNN